MIIGEMGEAVKNRIVPRMGTGLRQDFTEENEGNEGRSSIAKRMKSHRRHGLTTEAQRHRGENC
jgi:hypothetical protein